MNEWEFTGDVASDINVLLSRTPISPFKEAKCEQTGKGSRKRRDLTILDRDSRVVLTGEIKLPYQSQGSTPFNQAVVADARKKAVHAQSQYFFTWNVNEFVLWNTEGDATWQGHNYKIWEVADIRNESHLDTPATRQAIRSWLDGFLIEYARILAGTSPIEAKAPDEKFIEVLESSLRLPVLITYDELSNRYKRVREKRDLDKWMLEQGWIIAVDEAGIRENLERAAKFACYAFVNKLVFHEALLRRYSPKMKPLAIPIHVIRGDDLRLHIEGYFDRAKDITGDYETVFGEEHSSIGNRIPFYSDHAVTHWRELIDRIHDFDFTKLDYEIIGNVFERLIGPDERKKYGQFYTRPEVVDLINSFCIRSGDEVVMDPACGGGTFLVRAYARKRELNPSKTHAELLEELYGIDIAAYPTQLTTINLATRDLVEEANYPRVARADFFDIKLGSPILSLQKHEEIISKLDAIVGNLPYVRQEGIRKSKDKKHPDPGTKERYAQLVSGDVKLSGRSDLHCYFWPYAKSFLNDGGYLCFLTSSQWLDVEYGFRLQEWMLKGFEILAIMESIDEPWFVGARVATTVTILRLQPDEQKRMNNTVRFVQLRRPIREILAHDGTSADAVQAVDAFRDEILKLTENTLCERYRARLVKQKELWNQGVELGKLMSKSDKDEEEDEERNGRAPDTYYGGKWGVWLRAPDLWFDLLDKYGDRLVPLGKIADVRFGVKSGKDSFFYPKDCSAECLQAHESTSDFKRAYNVPRRDVSSGKVKLVRCGDEMGLIKPIESKYLEPEVHSLMEIDGFTVKPEDCARMILLVGKKRSQLKNTWVNAYIAWGEDERYDELPTCSGRQNESGDWYNLTNYDRPNIILPKIQQYRLMAISNPHSLHVNSSLLGLFNVDKNKRDIINGILNSTFAILSRIIFARSQGNEGNIQLDVYSAKMMLIPDMSSTSEAVLDVIRSAFKEMAKRKTLAFISEQRLREMSLTESGKSVKLRALPATSELEMTDRRRLDDAVLQLLGIGSAKKRQSILDMLYSHMRDHFELVRQKEEKAIKNKVIASRRGVKRPEDVAREIFEEIDDKYYDLLQKYDPDFLDADKPFNTYEIPKEGEPEEGSDLITESAVRFKIGKKSIGLVKTRHRGQSDLVVLTAQSGIRGLVRYPLDEKECKRLLVRYRKFVIERNNRLRAMIEDRVADEDMQEKIFVDLLRRVITARVRMSRP